MKGASAQEIIDARQGEVTLGANITKVKSQLAGKVDKVEGKGLSSNDFTNSLKGKLEGIDFKGYAHDITYDEINHILKNTNDR